MSALIVNAAPMVIEYGTQDLSTRKVPREPVAVPQHLPKFYLYTRKGPTTPQLVSGVERSNMYDPLSFDLRSKYANHATVFSNLVNAEGNAQMIQRVIPANAGPKANFTLWLDVLSDTVAVPLRNVDGSIKLLPNGQPDLGEPSHTVSGYRVKFVVTNETTVSDLDTKFGKQTVVPGTLTTSGGTPVVSNKYPILQFKNANIGEYGNLCGFKIWAPTELNSTGLPTKLLNEKRVYPYFASFVRKNDVNSSPSTVENIFGDQRVTIVFKPETIDPSSDSEVYIGDNLLSNYQNLNDATYPLIFGDFEELAIYQDNIDLLLGLFHTTEKEFIGNLYMGQYGGSDFTADATDKYLFNFIGGTSSKGVPYFTYQFVDDANSVRLSEYSFVYAKGGSDGTMSDALFSGLVGDELVKYSDPNNVLQENAINVESVFYDSGFTIETKYKIAHFLSKRKDTFAHVSTYDVLEPVKTASEEHSRAIALRTRFQMYPESDYFGTPVMRASIWGYSAKLKNSQYTGRLPLSAEIAIKSSKYMGAGEGKWKSGFNFDGAPNSIINNMYDISIQWVPAGVRNRNWDIGLNWVQAYDRNSFFFPAYKTIYNDDTSVLNSYFTAMAICKLNKIANAAWREFSGVSGLTDAQLIQNVNNFVNNRVNGIFDNRYIVQPDAFISQLDNLRGYSWHLPIKIYSPSMKTVMTTYVQAYRISDLQNAQ